MAPRKSIKMRTVAQSVIAAQRLLGVNPGKAAESVVHRKHISLNVAAESARFVQRLIGAINPTYEYGYKQQEALADDPRPVAAPEAEAVSINEPLDAEAADKTCNPRSLKTVATAVLTVNRLNR